MIVMKDEDQKQLWEAYITGGRDYHDDVAFMAHSLIMKDKDTQLIWEAYEEEPSGGSESITDKKDK